MTSAAGAAERARALEVEVELIDTDVHLAPVDDDELISYMPERWRSRLGDRRRLALRTVYRSSGSPLRLDAVGPDGRPAGTDPDFVKSQLFVEEGADFGLIGPLKGFGADPDLNAAVASALNAWQADTWLAEDDVRLFGSIAVSFDSIPSAVRELEEWAGHPGFKQVLIPHDSDRPLGHPQYEPLWAAAARHGLPVAMHFNESQRTTVGGTGAGIFTSHVEFHALSRPIGYAAHLASWICSGVFSRLPDFRVAFLEGGFLWHRPVVARIAHRWDEKRLALPDALKHPVQCLHEHVRFASQPMEQADPEEDVAGMLVAYEADKLLMFSSDYPHYDYDDPKRVLPRGVDPAMRRRIMCENAREFYGLPKTRPAGPYDVPAAT